MWRQLFILGHKNGVFVNKKVKKAFLYYFSPLVVEKKAQIPFLLKAENKQAARL